MRSYAPLVQGLPNAKGYAMSCQREINAPDQSRQLSRYLEEKEENSSSKAARRFTVKAKEYLRQISECRSRVRQLDNQLNGIKITMDEIKSVDLEMIRPPGYETSAIINRIEKLNEIAEDIINEKVNLETTKDRIRKEIQSLPNTKRANLLFKRYVEGKKLETIADEMGYSHIDIRREHGLALRDFEVIVLKRDSR